MKLIIHCGIPKTGSSSIQGALHSNRETMLKRGIVYPFAGRESRQSPAHYLLHHAMREEVETETRSVVANIGSAIRCEIGPHTRAVVISCEMLSFISEKSVWERFFNALDVTDITPVFYLRERDSWVRSWHRQAIKIGSSNSNLIEFEKATPFPFQKSIDTLRHIVGDSQVIVSSYENLPNRDVLTHFLNLIPGLHSAEILFAAQKNVTPSLEVLAKIRRINSLDLTSPQRRAVVEALLKPVTAADLAAFEK